MRTFINITIFLGLSQLFLFSNALMGQELTARYTIPAGTPVSLELRSIIEDSDLAPGYIVDLEVKVDIIVEGKVLIRAGAYAEGVITEVQKPRSFGRAGWIVLEASLLQTADGQLVRVQGKPIQRKGNQRKGTAFGVPGAIAASGLLFSTPITLPALALGFFIKGQAANLPLGTVLHAQILENTPVLVKNENNFSETGYPSQMGDTQ